MAIYETFSKNQKRLSGGCRDVYSYDVISPKLRHQLLSIWKDVLGNPSGSTVYAKLLERIKDELPLLKPAPSVGSSYGDSDAKLDNLFLGANHQDAIDIVSLVCGFLWQYEKIFRELLAAHVTQLTPKQAIDQMNTRFLEQCVGYFISDGSKPQLMRREGEHLHQEAVIPALQLLYDEQFKGADAEYRSAHEHYRHGRYKECLNDCLKAFESTMKTICEKRGWTFPGNPIAADLVRVCCDHDLIPKYMQGHLKNGIPPVRNEDGGHGQGPDIKEVPPHLAEYLLHETAVTIVLLVDAFKALP
jgi:hypothetical protein